MNHALPSVLTALTLAAALAAQDAPPDAPPNPKTPQHERLAALVGTWRTETKMAAMPGVPGMEKPSEIVGTEHAELICNGLWLKVTGEGTCDGQDSSCYWLVGYDPHAKSYQCIVASSTDDASCSLDASYDEKTKIWHFHGNSPMGPFRSEFMMESADRSIETCFAKGQDGKETQFMRSVRTRVKGAVTKTAASATAGADKEASTPAALAALHADCGAWDADFKMEMPGMPAMTAKCREVIAPTCGGRWTWSDFRGEIMGAPFEGHALVGYDSKADRIVSFWFDSMNGACMRTEGTYDNKKQTFAMTGTSYDEQGKRGPVASTTTVTGKDARVMRMLFGEGGGQHVLTIAYRRAGK